MYLNLKTAFKPSKHGVMWRPPMLKGKYRVALVREFKKVNLPIFFTKVRNQNDSLYHIKPAKRSISIAAKRERDLSIRQAIEKADEEILKHRQKFINGRKNKGMDRIFEEVMPDWYDLAKTRISDELI